MKIFHALVPLLLVGILGSARADDAKMLHRNEWMLKVLNSSNVAVFANLTMEDIDRFEEEKCAKFGPDAYRIMEQGVEQLENCTDSVVQEINQHFLSNLARYRGNMRNAMKPVCNTVPALKSCWRQYTVTSFTCNDPSESTANDSIRIFDSLLDYGCYNEGQRIANIVLDGGPQCLTSNMDNIVRCAGESLINYLIAAERNGTVFNDIASLYNIHLGLAECTYAQQFQQCTKTVLQQCSSMASFVDEMFNVIKNETVCKDLLKPSPSLSNSLNDVEPDISGFGFEEELSEDD